jgi:hypothetical protein
MLVIRDIVMSARGRMLGVRGENLALAAGCRGEQHSRSMQTSRRQVGQVGHELLLRDSTQHVACRMYSLTLA